MASFTGYGKTIKLHSGDASLILCPGSEIRLARPELKRRFRIQLDLPNVRLQDLVEFDWQ